jgi:hypothetical protein
MAAASAPALVLRANLVRAFERAADAEWVWLVARAWLDFGWLLWAVGEMCGIHRGGALWLFFSGTACSSRSGLRLQLRACERWSSDNIRHWMAVGIIILCMLPASEAVGDIGELAADLFWAAPCCCILRLLVPEGTDPQILYWIGYSCLAVRLWQWFGLSALATRLWQWLMARQRTPHATVAAVSAAEMCTDSRDIRGVGEASML